jgi:uroporphyrinogen decarboxylase
MTNRERMLKVVRHQVPDRVPIKFHVRGELQPALLEYLGLSEPAELERYFGADGWGSVGIGIDFPGYRERCNGRLEGHMMFAGGTYIFHDERTFEDAWGTIRRVGMDRKLVQWIDGPLAHLDDPDDYDWPGPDRLLIPDDLAQQVRAQQEQGRWVAGAVTQPFKLAWELRGLENFLADYRANPSFVEKTYDHIYELETAMGVAFAAAGVDEFGIGGDIAMQDRVIMGPHLWRQFDKPRLAAMIAAVKRVKPDIQIFLHSDGDLTEILPDLIEIGFTIIDPIQPECMDVVEVKKRWGSQIVMHGTIGVQSTLPFGTVEEVRAEVKKRIEDLAWDGAFVLRAANEIMYDVPLENIVACFETARDYDLSRLPGKPAWAQ